jgi:hypothetical protein
MPQQLDLSKFNTKAKSQPEEDNIDLSIPPDLVDSEGDVGKSEEDKPGWLSKAWHAVSEPLTHAPSEFAKRVSEYINPERTTTGLRGVGSAYLESLGNAADTFTSPLSIGLGIASGGASLAGKAALPEIAQGFTTAGRVLSAPITAHGAYGTFRPDASLEERLTSIPEMVLGGLGLRGSLPEIAKSSVDEGILARAPKFKEPSGMDWVREQEARGRTNQPRPPGPWDENTPVDTGYTPKSADDRLFEMAMERHNMGRPLPEDMISNSGPVQEPTATGRVSPSDIFRKMESEGAFGTPEQRSTGHFEAPPGSLADVPNMTPYDMPTRAELPSVSNDMLEMRPEEAPTDPNAPFDASKLNFRKQLENSLAAKTPELVPENEQIGEVLSDGTIRNPESARWERQSENFKNSDRERAQALIEKSARGETLTPEENMELRLNRKLVEGDVVNDTAPSSTELDMSKFGGEPRNTGIADEPLTQENFDAKHERLKELIDLDSQNKPSKLTAADLEEGTKLSKQLRDVNFDKNNIQHKTNQDLLDYNKSISDAIAKKASKDRMSKTTSELNQEMFDKVGDADQKFLRLNELKEKAQSGQLSEQERTEAQSLASELRGKSIDEMRSKMGGGGNNKPPNKTTNVGPNPEPNRRPVFRDDLKSGVPVDYRAEPKPYEQSTAEKIYNAPRGMMSVDLPFTTSAAFRQAGPLAMTKNWFKAWGAAAKAYGSEEAANAIEQSIKSDPLFRPRFKPLFNKAGDLVKYKELPSISEEAGLKMSDLNNFTSREENIASNFAEKWMPGARRSNRAYTAFLNDLRRNKFNDMLKSFEDAGINTKNRFDLVKEAASFINNATGRGELQLGAGYKNINFEQNTRLLTNTLFSPRLIASRIKFLNPSTYMQASPEIRQEYIKGLARSMVTWWGISSLAEMAGAKVIKDIHNSDFGKIKFDNTRIDPGQGFQQLLVASARMLPNNMGGGFVSSTAPEGFATHQQTGSNEYNSKGVIAQRFFESKMHPTAKFAWDILKATKRGPVNVSDRALQLVLPMLTGDIVQAAQDDPVLAGMAGVASSIGMGAQSYGNHDFNKPIYLNNDNPLSFVVGRR